MKKRIMISIVLLILFHGLLHVTSDPVETKNNYEEILKINTFPPAIEDQLIKVWYVITFNEDPFVTIWFTSKGKLEQDVRLYISDRFYTIVRNDITIDFNEYESKDSTEQEDSGASIWNDRVYSMHGEKEGLGRTKTLQIIVSAGDVEGNLRVLLTDDFVYIRRKGDGTKLSWRIEVQQIYIVETKQDVSTEVVLSGHIEDSNNTAYPLSFEGLEGHCVTERIDGDYLIFVQANYDDLWGSTSIGMNPAELIGELEEEERGFCLGTEILLALMLIGTIKKKSICTISSFFPT